MSSAGSCKNGKWRDLDYNRNRNGWPFKSEYEVRTYATEHICNFRNPALRIRKKKQPQTKKRSDEVSVKYLFRYAIQLHVSWPQLSEANLVNPQGIAERQQDCISHQRL